MLFALGIIVKYIISMEQSQLTEQELPKAEHTVTALSEQEKQFRMFIAATSDTLYRMSADWNEMYMLTGNGLLADTPGTSKEWMQTYIPDSDKEKVLTAIAAAITTKNKFQLEHRVILADGTIGWTFSRAIPVLNADGVIKEWFGIATDITAHKQTEKNLAFLVTISKDLAGVTDIQLTLQMLSQKTAAHFGAAWCLFSERIADTEPSVASYGWNDANVPSLKGTYRMRDFVSEEQLAKNNAGLPSVCHNTQAGPAVPPEQYAKLGIQSFIIAPIAHHGQWQFMLSVLDSMPRQWRDDEVELLCELATRIWTRRERSKAEETLRESETRHRALFDSIDEGVCIMEQLPPRPDGLRDYRYLAMNPAMQAMFGLGDLSGETIRTHFPGAVEAWYDDYDRVLATGQPVRFVRETTTGNMVLEMFVTRLEDGTGKRLLAVLQDITQRKRLERLKDEFIGVASHELRTPVTGIKAYTQLLEEVFAEKGDEKSAELMQKLEVQVDRLNALIGTLLDTTRITEGKLKLLKTDFCINGLITETAETVQHISAQHTIQLQLEAAVPIHADRERIRQVLTNLIGNAVKYSPAADHIIISTSVIGRELQVCVQDFGIGMTEEAQQQVFDQFYRSSEAGTFSGLGLGLYISASIIREHGGCIWVESRPGKGALFCFMLPLVRV